MKKKNDFTVIPGLSIKSRELEKRMGNRSIKLSEDGKSYTLDREVVATMRMTRAELFRSHLKGQQELNALQSKAEAESKAIKAKKEEERIAKIKADAIAEHTKQQQNG